MRVLNTGLVLLCDWFILSSKTVKNECDKKIFNETVFLMILTANSFIYIIGKNNCFSSLYHSIRNMILMNVLGFENNNFKHLPIYILRNFIWIFENISFCLFAILQYHLTSYQTRNMHLNQTCRMMVVIFIVFSQEKVFSGKLPKREKYG